jgi:hypothetical protein
MAALEHLDIGWKRNSVTVSTEMHTYYLFYNANVEGRLPESGMGAQQCQHPEPRSAEVKGRADMWHQWNQV